MRAESPATSKSESMPGGRRLAFAMGAPGHIAIDGVASGMLLYFYLPPPGRGLEAQVSEETFLGLLTAFGLAVLIARIVDSLASPLVGYASDRSHSRFGRRRSFMLYGLLPMTLLPALAYWPPAAPGSTTNMVTLMLLISCYYIFSTMYVGPHQALIPEIAQRAEDRARLSRIVSVAGIPMGALVMAWPRIMNWGQDLGLEPTDAIRMIAMAFSLLALAFCALPLFVIDEARFTHATPSDLPLGDSLTRALRNRPFLIFIITHAVFALATTLIFPTLPYMATILLGRSEGFALELGASMAGTLGVGYAMIPRLLKRFSPKPLMIGCFALFGVGAASLGMIHPDIPGGPDDTRNLWIAFLSLGLLGVPLAGSAILPSVLLGQIIDEERALTGANRSAVFIGFMHTFDKWAYGLAIALVAFLFARLGKSPAEPMGVLLIGPIAGIAGILSALLFTLYPNQSGPPVPEPPSLLCTYLTSPLASPPVSKERTPLHDGTAPFLCVCYVLTVPVEP